METLSQYVQMEYSERSDIVAQVTSFLPLIERGLILFFSLPPPFELRVVDIVSGHYAVGYPLWTFLYSSCRSIGHMVTYLARVSS